MTDFLARLNQSACDKLISSVSYPFVAFERREPFPGCGSLLAIDRSEYTQLSNAETDKLFSSCVRGRPKLGRRGPMLEDQLFTFGGSIIQQAKTVLNASDDPKYQGPPRSDLELVINGGVEKLGPSLRKIMGDWGLYAWCPHLKITIKRRPSISLRSPRIDLNGIRVNITATGELYAKYPWWNCYRWCTQWDKVIKCDRIGSVTISVDIAIEAHAILSAQGANVFATAEFDRLRLDYPILRLLPLEDLVNPALRHKKLKIYDASNLIATIPVLESRFRVKTISLPPVNPGVQIDVTVEQI